VRVRAGQTAPGYVLALRATLFVDGADGGERLRADGGALSAPGSTTAPFAQKSQGCYTGPVSLFGMLDSWAEGTREN
jgi:hypothetical protein